MSGQLFGDVLARRVPYEYLALLLIIADSGGNDGKDAITVDVPGLSWHLGLSEECVRDMIDGLYQRGVICNDSMARRA